MTTRILITSVALAVAVATTAAAGHEPVTVREAGGEYSVSARFTVPGPAVTAREVLTDYANIPRFMPDVRSSVVIHRQDAQVRVEQRATPRFMWFSKDIYLVLEVSEGAEVIRFRDSSNRSFSRYDGSWTIEAASGETRLAYELNARPAFDVPGFMLRKLFKRDAVAMIGRLQAEIAARARAE